MLKFKPFQVDDYARAAMVDGCILAHDTGLGKTYAAFAWPQLKGALRPLIVAPEQLHDQFAETGRRFGITVIPLRDRLAFDAFKLWRAPRKREKPVFYITSYYWLAHVGGDHRRDGINGIGERCHKTGIVCCENPTLSQLASWFDAFDCLVVDEATGIQSTDATIATSVRSLKPRYRLLLTATPVKNRMESIFWLAQWASEANGRDMAWPYPATEAGREKFANQHCHREKFITRESEYAKKTGRSRKIERRGIRACNLHSLWMNLSPIIIRRTKADCGEDLVPRNLSIVRLPMGRAQSSTYRAILFNPPRVSKGGAALQPSMVAAAQLMQLRQAALCPDSGNLSFRSATDLTPKMLACLSITRDALTRGEQIVIGSPFRHFSRRLYARLLEAGIRVCLLNGDVAPSERGILAAQFKRGHFRVMVAGQNAMGHGISLECANNIILPAIDWPFDANEQFLGRVWRLNSPKPVNAYMLVAENTIDEYLLHVYREKSATSAVTLNGVDLAFSGEQDSDLLKVLIAHKSGYDPHATTSPEQELAAKWESDVLPGLKQIAVA